MSDFPVIKDHLVANPDKYTMTTNPDGTVTLRPTWVDNPSEVLQEGTAVDAAFLQKIPEAIDAIDEKVTSQLADKATKTYVDQLTQSIASGSPKGTYATVAALTTAFPTGNTNIYVVSADGKWYFWNGSAWTAGGVYQATALSTADRTALDTSARSIYYINRIPNGKPTSQTGYSFALSTGAYNATEQAIEFTPTGANGSVTYYGLSGFKTLNKKLLIQFRIKSATARAGISLLLAQGATNTLIRAIPALTTEYQTVQIFTDRMTFDDTNVDTAIRIYDTNASGFVKISLKELIVVDLTSDFGYGKEPTTLALNFFDGTLNTGVVKEALVAKEAESLKNDGRYAKPIFVNIESEVLKTVSKYSANQDVIFELGKRGVNNIFDFKSARLKNNTSNSVSNNTSHDATLWWSGTDSFGPYVVRAINNADGDNQVATHATGGNHGYDNSGSSGQSATGRTHSVVFKVEGRAVTSYNDYATNVEVVWTNFIQANNTKKADGSGREVLKETIRLLFDGIEWKVEHSFELLEDVFIESYFGLQIVADSYAGGLYYHSSPLTKWEPISVVRQSQNLVTSAFTLRNVGMTDFVEIGVDLTHGIGRRNKLGPLTYSAFNSTVKAYTYLMHKQNVLSGEVYTFRGYYRFYSLN